MYRVSKTDGRALTVTSFGPGFSAVTPDPYALITVTAGNTHLDLRFTNPVELFNLYRALGEALDEIVPGLVSPLPETNPLVAKVIYEADRIRRGL